MHKIASPNELQAELRAIMAFIHASEKPDRQVVAEKLSELADRVADRFKLARSAGEATFKKLRDGSWGLLVNNASVRPGDQVLTLTKAGKQSYQVVGKVVWSGGGVSICTIDKGEGEGQSRGRGDRDDDRDGCSRCRYIPGRRTTQIWEECEYCGTEPIYI